MSTSKNIPTPRVRAQIAFKANVSVATVYRYYVNHASTRPALADAIRKASAEILADAANAVSP